MNRPKVLNKMQEESLWSSCPVNDVDTVLPNRYSPYSAFSLLYCDLYLRDFKESLKHTMLDQESVFEDQIHELHRLYRRQKALMMEREEANNLYSQTQHFLLDSGVSSLTRSLHLMGSCISTSKASVFPPEESAFSKINETGEKVMDLEYIGEEEEEEGSKNGEVVNFPKDPAQTRSERAEPEAQELQISTKSQPVSLPGKHGSGPFRSIVQALPSLSNIPLFHKRWSEPPRKKKPKRGAKSTNVGTFTRSKARKGSNIDSSFGLRKDDNHSLSTSSYIPESDQNQKYPEKRSLISLLEMESGRSWTKTGKRRRRKKRLEESDKVTREVPRTRSMTRGSCFLVTEKEEQEKSAAAAEAIVDMSDSPKKSTIIKTSDCNTTLHWFAKIASSFVEDSKREVGLSVTRSHSNYKIDYFEAMTLQLTEMEPEEQRTSTPVSNIVHPKNKRTLRSKGRRQQLQRDSHNDLRKIGRLMEASETNDAYSSYNSLMENMRFDWGAIRKRRRGIRSPAATTKTCRGFLQVPFSGS